MVVPDPVLIAYTVLLVIILTGLFAAAVMHLALGALEVLQTNVFPAPQIVTLIQIYSHAQIHVQHHIVLIQALTNVLVCV